MLPRTGLESGQRALCVCVCIYIPLYVRVCTPTSMCISIRNNMENSRLTYIKYLKP